MMRIRLYTFIVLTITSTIWLHLTAAAPSTSYGTCFTPNRIEGSCINLEDCRYLAELVLDPQLTQNDRAYLSNSQCGYRNKKVLICCPPHFLNQSATMITTTERSPPTSVLFPDSNMAKPKMRTTNNRDSGSAKLSMNNSSSLLLTYPQCGNALNNRIFGGTETAIDEFPWTALIEYTKSTGERNHYCGGALINNRYVLTAAHCVKVSGFRLSAVRLGEWDTRTNPDCSPDGCAPNHKDYGIAESIAHPGYMKQNDPNDIALIRLAETVEFNDFIKPICLPTPTNLRSDTFVDTAMDVVGWGSTERSQSSTIKLKATIKGKELDVCRQKYNEWNGLRLYPSQLCAGGELGIDSCRGDSGGPLMFQDSVNGKAAYYLAGVVSFGPTPCGLEGWPAIYTRVGAFIDWIESSMQP